MPVRTGETSVGFTEDRDGFQIIKPMLPQWAGWLRVKTDDYGVPVRHRVAYGGRGGAKSWTFAEELIIRGTEDVERILCAREFQRSIRDSVKRLLDDTINRLGLGVLGNGFYRSTDTEIRGANGTLFVFAGLHRNENGIKSLEGITICWVEEARVVSQDSIDSLTPTIRAEGAEIWWSYNPKLSTDPVDKMFRGKDGPPPGTILINVNAEDNPWFPLSLRRDMEYDKKRDFEKYSHIWRGAYIQLTEAKVFRNWKIRRFDTPDDAVLRFGADWGFSVDPSVLVRSFIGRWSGEPWNSEPIADPDGRVLFVDREAYAVGCPIDETPALFAGSDVGQPPGRERWPNPNQRPGIPGAHLWKIVADSARPEIIAYMKARGFSIEPAIKGKDSIEEGVTFLQSYDICVHEDCKHVADELLFYEYKTDKLTGEVLPVLKDAKNHTIDALRYALEAVRRARHGKVIVASAGERATVREAVRTQEAAMRNAQLLPPGSAAPDTGGAGWGSVPGIRTGVLG
jgi:phage terminase large subunit